MHMSVVESLICVYLCVRMPVCGCVHLYVLYVCMYVCMYVCVHINIMLYD